MRIRTRVIVATVGLGVLLAGCDRVPKGAVQSCNADVPVLPAKTDILFVVDDSGSMAEEQENLRENLSTFVVALASSPVPHDFQIGVTTTDVLDFDGLNDAFPINVAPYSSLTYEIPYPKGTLVAVDPVARTDATKAGLFTFTPPKSGDPLLGFAGPGVPRILPTGSPTLVQDFEANVLVGLSGSGKEQPFHALQLALTERIADANAGFLRDGARLGVVILTDEDDCSELSTPYVGDSNGKCHDPRVKAASLAPVADLVDFLQGTIAGEARDPVLAVIAGFDPTTLAPTGCGNSYDDPTRLDEAVTRMGADHTLRASICDPSFGPMLQTLADLLVPQTVPLQDAPSDARMLLVAVQKAAGALERCAVAAAGADGAAGADAVFTPPRQGKPGTLKLQNACRLHGGDQLSVRLVCAG
jgi:hypothetical protein